MQKPYIKPKIETMSFLNISVLCMSRTTTIEQKPNIKKYGCPIKQGVDCPDYDKEMYEYELAIEHLAETKRDFTFYQGSDEEHCPRKTTCPIYLERKKQQKTR